MTNVVKRDGKREAFNPEKLRRSVKKAAIDAGHELGEKEEVVEAAVSGILKQASDRAEMTTDEIRKNILSQLEEADSTISTAWRRFDDKYKIGK